MSVPTDILGARILIVDDEPANLRLLEYTLRRAGYLAVASTREPLEVCTLHRRNHYDLILLDLQMPRLNGFQVMEELARTGGAKKDVILVLSADPAQMVRVLESGATGFLSKPFVLAEVVLRVRQMLEATWSRPQRPLPGLAMPRLQGRTTESTGGAVNDTVSGDSIFVPGQSIPNLP